MKVYFKETNLQVPLEKNEIMKLQFCSKISTFLFKLL